MNRRLKVWLAGLLGVVAVGVPLGLTQGGGAIDVFVGSTPTPTGATCTTTISSGANLGTSISGMSGGQTLCLNAGTYNTGLSVTSFSPASTVTIRPVAGATVTVNGFDVTSSSNLKFTLFASPGNFKGFTITTSTNVEFSYNNVDGGCPNGPASCGGVALIATHQLASNAHVVFSHNTITGVSAGASSQEGSIELTNTGSCQASAANPPVTVEYNLFDQGLSDGIQLGGNECRSLIQYNVFQGKTEPGDGTGPCIGYAGNSCPHVDAIQGVADVVGLRVIGNYMRNEVDCILTADGSYTDTTFTENVCIATTAVRPIQASGWTGTTSVRHNTIVSSVDSTWDSTHASLNSSGMTGLDNILITGLSNGSQTGGGQWTTWDYNLSDCASSNPCGTHNQDLNPTFTGGATPSTWAGYRLTSGSNGHLAASDGTDMGASFTTTPGP